MIRPVNSCAVLSTQNVKLSSVTFLIFLNSYRNEISVLWACNSPARLMPMGLEQTNYRHHCIYCNDSGWRTSIHRKYKNIYAFKCGSCGSAARQRLSDYIPTWSDKYNQDHESHNAWFARKGWQTDRPKEVLVEEPKKPINTPGKLARWLCIGSSSFYGAGTRLWVVQWAWVGKWVEDSAGWVYKKTYSTAHRSATS
jgi:transcription elongation factor Elf1